MMGIENIKFDWSGSVDLDAFDVIRIVAVMREFRERTYQELLKTDRNNFSYVNEYDSHVDGLASIVSHCDSVIQKLEKASTTANDTDFDTTNY